MDVKLQTLTPLWTGGVDAGKVDRIHETGIIGSLRWWYEVLVRGLGGNACDPTTHTCLYDPQKPDDGICEVCRVFGATGWRRRFRLTIADHTKQDTSSPKTIIAHNRPTNPKTRRKPTWWFPDHPRSGNLTIRIQSLAPDFSPEVIAGLVQFIADWGAIGARAQMGFGVVKPEKGRMDTQPLYDWLCPLAGTRRYPDLPSLQNLFLARVQIQSALDEEAFNLKHDLRRLFADDRNVRHLLMGTVSGGRMAAKIKVSRPFADGLMRVWGWIPENAREYRGPWNRTRAVQAIHEQLNSSYALQVWREMNSTRDTATPESRDPQAFLQSLLGLKEEQNAA